MLPASSEASEYEMNRCWPISSVLAGLIPLLAFSVVCGEEPALDFDRDVAPIFIRRCLECHAGGEPSGGLALDRLEGIKRGGDSGAAIEIGKADASLLIEKVSAGEMPPKREGKPRPLPPEEIAVLKRWIADGAKWPEGRALDIFERTTDQRGGRDWWSLQPIHVVDPPKAADGEPITNPIDAFVLDKLRSQGWSPAPPAERRTLARRVYFDLWGLQPGYDEIEAFVADDSPDAYEKLVDKLLASPKFGERWARHWLDVARYAETCGYERDQVKPNVWKYRDWVVAAMNDDKPFDQFLVEQLAGDELPERNEQSVIATGFLRLGTWNDEPNDPAEYQYDRLEDMVHATTSAFLSLTVKCARCHDHKFDPIRHTDYYRIGAAFWAGYIAPGPREHLGGPETSALGFDVFGWTDRGRDAEPLRWLKKGDIHRPGDVVNAGALSAIPTLDRPFEAPPEGAKTTQRRLQLARWMANPDNPLTSRVWVNRMWQHHFGEGLVRSVDNFGFTGDKPTHPELLDWLAGQLIANGWKSKPLHKLMVMSATYRQASVHPMQNEYAERDAGNQFLWHASRRRLDAETIRDALLSASGQIDLSRVGGPSFAPDIEPDALEGLSMKGNAWKASPPEEQRRRSLYVFSKRGLLPPLLTVFDSPDTTLPCGRRDVSIVAPQALALLNNAFVHKQSEALAAKIASQTPDAREQAIAAWKAVLSRTPRESEIKLALEHLADQETKLKDAPANAALASLCHVLMNANEFVFVD